jgi:hypothetical protein
MSTRKLRLHRESLRRLDHAQLVRVVGGGDSDPIETEDLSYGVDCTQVPRTETRTGGTRTTGGGDTDGASRNILDSVC